MHGSTYKQTWQLHFYTPLESSGMLRHGDKQADTMAVPMKAFPAEPYNLCWNGHGACQHHHQSAAKPPKPGQPDTFTDYSKYMIGIANVFAFQALTSVFADVVVKFLSSFTGLCAFPADATTSGMRGFIRHILLHSKISYSTVATGLLYLLWCKQALRARPDRLRHRIDIYELFVASLILASKYLNDRNAYNSAWSQVSGIPLDGLNRIEMILLSTIEYRLHIDIQLFDRWIGFLFQPATEFNRMQVNLSPNTTLK